MTDTPVLARLFGKDETFMPNLIVEVTPEKLAELLRDLPAEQLKTVLAKVADRLEVQEWMSLAESGFQEWLTEPDLYANELSSR